MVAEADLDPPPYAAAVSNVDDFAIIQNIFNETGQDAEAGQVLRLFSMCSSFSFSL